MRWLTSNIWRRLRGGQAAAPLDTVGDVTAGVPARLAAMNALEASGGPPVVAALCAVLDDAHSAVRSHAASILGRLRDKAAIDPLCRRLWHVLRDPQANFDDVGYLADALCAFTGDQRPVEALRAALLDHRSYGVQTVAVDLDTNLAESIATALERLGGLRLIIDGYAGALRLDDELLRRHAARELSGIAWRNGTGFDELTAGERDALRTVLRTAAADPSSHVRYHGGRGLEHLAAG